MMCCLTVPASAFITREVRATGLKSLTTVVVLFWWPCQRESGTGSKKIGSRLLSGSGSISSGMNVNQNEKRLWKFPGRIDLAKSSVSTAQFLPHNTRRAPACVCIQTPPPCCFPACSPSLSSLKGRQSQQYAACCHSGSFNQGSLKSRAEAVLFLETSLWRLQVEG